MEGSEPPIGSGLEDGKEPFSGLTATADRVRECPLTRLFPEEAASGPSTDMEAHNQSLGT